MFLFKIMIISLLSTISFYFLVLTVIRWSKNLTILNSLLVLVSLGFVIVGIVSFSHTKVQHQSTAEALNESSNLNDDDNDNEYIQMPMILR